MIIGVLTNAERHAQMAEAIKRFPMLKKHEKFSDKKISIVCYGPSLRETWRQINNPMITTSGAHDYLMVRGVIPDWHVDCDPRSHKAAMLTPNGGTRYLMASVCHPDMWAKLRGKNVKLWHLINGDDFQTPAWIHSNHPEGKDSMIGGGSTVGMRAMEVAAHMGFRRFDIYGMDCSVTDRTHAAEHLGKVQETITVQVGGRPFKTTPQMLQAAREMEQFIQTYDAEITFHGEGLMQATARFLKERKAA